MSGRFGRRRDRQLFCPYCEADVPVDSVDLARLVAPCGRCGATVDLADQIAEPGDWMPVDTSAFSAPKPDGITVVETDESLMIERRWLAMSQQGAQFVVTAIGLVGLLTILAVQGSPLWLVAGLTGGVAWYLLKWALNRSVVTVGSGRLRVDHRPMSGPEVSLDATAVVQLYTTRRAMRGHRRRETATTLYHHDLVAILRDGTHVRVLKSIADPDQATYLERELERRLGIDDQPVRGEIS